MNVFLIEMYYVSEHLLTFALKPQRQLFQLGPFSGAYGRP